LEVALPRPLAPLLLALIGCASVQRAPAPEDEPLQIALTFDDLPRHGPEVPGLSRLQIHQKLLAALRKHGAPPAYGFVNARPVEAHPEDHAALQAWLDAGQPLGSHTFSHPDLRKVGLAAYLEDIDRNEPPLRELHPGAPDERWKMFRYPYLRESVDLASRDAIRRHLFARGYRIAEVTIDFSDWAYNAPYARCLQSGDARSIEHLKRSYLRAAITHAEWAAAAARQLYGRPIKHVLLLHVGAFDAEVLDELLSRYEKRGVKLIPLEEALADPIYAEDPRNDGDTVGLTFLEQVIESRKAPHPPWFSHPLGLLDAICQAPQPASP
jgi:peptidoglycan/xylan/chitin deacetylase (PgdA/CDA1 family)